MIRFRHLLCFAALAIPLQAQAQTVTAIETDGAVTAITQTPRGSYVETTRGTFRLERGDCAGDVCLVADVIRGLPEKTPDGALPDGKIATADGGDIRKAWYGQPTERYQHCVLGDCVEGGSLVVETADGAQAEIVLPDNQVFEDITPRLFDFNNDGANEVVTIRASQSGGAAVVVYRLRDGELVEVAASAENGQRNRWLNIAEIIDNTVHFIRTPHIGGRWSTLTLNADGSARSRDDIRTNVSNHLIGARELDLAEAYDGGGTQSLFVPSQDRQTLIDVLDARADIALPAPIAKAIIGINDLIVTATDDGTLLAIKP